MRRIFKNQIYHFISYIVLGIILLASVLNTTSDSKVLGLYAVEWIVLSWIAAGLFQAWVMIFWRLELYHGKISKYLGINGFLIFRTGFIILGSIRLLPVIPISFLTRNTMELNEAARIILIVGTTPLIIWGMYSVIFYFGINRAFGADHFFKEYRNKQLERRGTFKYIPNSMYTIILLVLYHPALFYESTPGLITAFVHHIFVWVHYFCTEKPDMKEIYG